MNGWGKNRGVEGERKYDWEGIKMREFLAKQNSVAKRDSG